MERPSQLEYPLHNDTRQCHAFTVITWLEMQEKRPKKQLHLKKADKIGFDNCNF